MGFLHVFETIVDIMHHDYAGSIDKRGWDRPDYFRNELGKLESSSQLSRVNFERIINDYLLDFKDDHNALRSTTQEAPPQSVGFRVRHYGNTLYIDRIEQENRLDLATVITEIDGVGINEIADKKRRYLKSDIQEREWWDTVLLEATTITIECDGLSEQFVLKTYESKRQPSQYSFKKIEDIGIFQFNDFSDLKQMQDLLVENKAEIATTNQWIIDVRECRGGSDSVYFPLLDGIFHPNPTITEDGMYHLMTERNYKNRINALKKFQKGPDPFIDAFIHQMKINRGKGFVQFDFSEFEEENPIKGSQNPRQIIVMTDKFCGSSGEQFVLDVRQSQKVTIIGRPTRGVLDYSNQAVEHFENEGYEFVYATSKSARVERGAGIDFIGIKPDVYIEWTPEHLVRDVDLEYGIGLLKSKV